MYTPEPPDLGRLNTTLVEWMEEAVSNHPNGEYLVIPDQNRCGAEEEEAFYEF